MPQFHFTGTEVALIASAVALVSSGASTIVTRRASREVARTQSAALATQERLSAETLETQRELSKATLQEQRLLANDGRLFEKRVAVYVPVIREIERVTLELYPNLWDKGRSYGDIAALMGRSYDALFGLSAEMDLYGGHAVRETYTELFATYHHYRRLLEELQAELDEELAHRGGATRDEALLNFDDLHHQELDKLNNSIGKLVSGLARECQKEIQDYDRNANGA